MQVRTGVRRVLIQTADLLETLPIPQKDEVLGVQEYIEDMRELTPVLVSLLRDTSALANPHFKAGAGYRHPEQVVGVLEKWVALREKAQWRLPVPSIEALYSEYTRGSE